MKRNKKFKIRMSEDELESLDLKVKLCKCSREKFVRETLLKSVPNVPPPIEYQRLINEIQMVVHDINYAIHQGSG